MRTQFKYFLALAMSLSSLQGTCYAHSFSPLLIPFFPLMLPGISAKLLGICLEAILLKLVFCDIALKTNFFRSACVNVVSSAFGFLSFFIIPEWTIMWFNPFDAATTLPFLLILLVITAVEIPLLKWFYRHSGLTWPKAIIVSIATNSFSCFGALLFLFVFYPVYWGVALTGGRV